VYLIKDYTAQKLLKEFPSNSWIERSLRKTVKITLTPVQLTGAQGPADQELRAYCGECDLELSE